MLERIRAENPWLPILGVIALVAALRATHYVTLPLAFATFLVMLTWPLQAWLEERVPRWLAVVLSALAILSVAAGFVVSVGYILSYIAGDLPRYLTRVQEGLDGLLAGGSRFGLPFESTREALQQLGEQATSIVGDTVKFLTRFVGWVVLVTVFLVLLQSEATHFLRRARDDVADPTIDRLIEVGTAIGGRFRRYFVVRTVTGLVTAALAGLFLWAVGVPGAGVWAALMFLLFYIPTVGPLSATLPPALVAFATGGSVAYGLGVLGGLVGITVVLGDLVEPKLQGANVKLSPVLVLFSVVFWGWVWGVPGAILGVPITVSLLVLFDHFERTRWIAVLADASERGG